MPGKQCDRKVIVAQSDRNSHHEYRVDTFTVNPWWHTSRARDWVIRNGKEADVSRLQSARARRRWHFNGYARIGQRNRDICALVQQGYSDSQIANIVNAAHLWHLTPIRRRRVCAIRHQHRGCPTDSPCNRPDLLETLAAIPTGVGGLGAGPSPHPTVSRSDDGGRGARATQSVPDVDNSDKLPTAPLSSSLSTIGSATLPARPRPCIMTRSPTTTSATPEPTSAIMPQGSCPATFKLAGSPRSALGAR